MAEPSLTRRSRRTIMRPMKITRLDVSHLKLLRSVTLDFTRDGAPRPWTVLIGENGTCKTTLLQAIGLLASGETRANQLVEAHHLRDVRATTPEDLTELSGRFALGPGPHGPSRPVRPASFIESGFVVFAGEHRLAGGSGFLDEQGRLLAHDGLLRLSEDVEQGRIPAYQAGPAAAQVRQRYLLDPLDAWRSRNDPGALVLGYGVSRFLPQPLTSPRPDDLAKERLQPLFGSRPLLGTDFVEHLARRDPAWGPAFDRQVTRALLEIDEAVVPRLDRIDLIRAERPAEGMISDHRFTFRAGGEGVKLPATWLSQGYQATIAWIADLIGHAFWDARAPVACEDIEALVLIDELDLHLHPRWQSGFVLALKRVFPKVQFVATTHSPMVLPGLAADEVVRLEFDAEGDVVPRSPDITPATLTGSGLYDHFFGVSHATPDALASKLRRFGFLVGHPGRSAEEDAEMKRLRAELRAAGIDPGWEPVPVDPALQDP